MAWLGLFLMVVSFWFLGRINESIKEFLISLEELDENINHIGAAVEAVNIKLR